MTRNCQIYDMQLDGVFFLQILRFSDFIKENRNYLFNSACSFVSPKFRFKSKRHTSFISLLTRDCRAHSRGDQQRHTHMVYCVCRTLYIPLEIRKHSGHFIFIFPANTYECE